MSIVTIFDHKHNIHAITFSCLDSTNVDKKYLNIFNSILEMRLAHMSMSKEERRDITKLYNPTTLAAMNERYPFLDWTKYVNEILTKDTVQVLQ